LNGALTGTLLVLLWGMVLLRLPTLWRDTRQRALWATLCTLALAKTAALLPEPRMVPRLLGVVCAYFLLRFLSLITGRARIRDQVVLAGSALLTLILLSVTPADSIAYWVVLNGYLGAVCATATVLFWRISRSAPAGLLRHGLRAMAIGTALVTLYAAVKTGIVGAHHLGVMPALRTVEPVADAVRTVGMMIAVVGAAVPAGGKLRSVLSAYRALWVLRPLWRPMRQTFPDLILIPRRRAVLDLIGVNDVQLRLYRRVIEIRDGMLMLRDYLPAGALAEAREFAGDDPALVEACGIALALARHHSGAPPAENGDRWAEIGGGMAEEVAWLGAVSTAFRRDEPAAFARRAATPVSS
jgi:hypothetical protein